jgi:CHAT domain-containing protein
LPREQGEIVHDNRFYLGFLVEPSGTVTRIEFGDAAEVDAAIESFVERVSARLSFSRQARRLDRLVAEPLREKLSGESLLIVSADGWFHRLPWAALPGTTKQYWIEEIAFASIPSAQSLVSRDVRPVESAPMWLVVGGVDYGAPQLPWTSLASSASEAQNIDQLLRRRYTQSKAGTILTGNEATKEKIRSLMPTQSYIHFATHGSFVDRQADAFDIQGISAQLDSFLVCAGANQAEHVDQAYLTAEEIGNLDMRGTDVVTLSACETGLGHVRAGQGLIGLVAALDRAGAGAVVSALWKVDDAATARLMEEFYAHLLEDDNFAPIIAIRDAQLELLKNSNGRFEHPFYWAPWSITGVRGEFRSL